MGFTVMVRTDNLSSRLEEVNISNTPELNEMKNSMAIEGMFLIKDVMFLEDKEHQNDHIKLNGAETHTAENICDNETDLQEDSEEEDPLDEKDEFLEDDEDCMNTLDSDEDSDEEDDDFDEELQEECQGISLYDSDEEEEKEEEQMSARNCIKHEIPFWFSHEDKEQLQCIIERYSRELKLPEERKKRVRQAPPFVGRVKRTEVKNGLVFTTMDEIEIFNDALLPAGCALPKEETHFLITNWSKGDGVPTTCFAIKNQQIEFWKSRATNTEPSYIMCLPLYGRPGSFDYFVTEEPVEVTCSSLSPGFSKQCCYESFIPEFLRSPKHNKAANLRLQASPILDSLFEPQD